MTSRTLGVVLAGGRSSRMGRDKALLEIGGETFLQRTARTLAAATEGDIAVSVAEASTAYASLAWTLIPDDSDLKDCGPIGGVVSAMRWARGRKIFDRILTLSVDMPLVTTSAIQALARGSPGCAVASHSGSTNPTFAVWLLDTLDDIERLSSTNGRRALHAILARIGAVPVPLDTFDPAQFVNVNTPDDYAALRSLI